MSPRPSKLDAADAFAAFSKAVGAGERFDVLALAGQESLLISQARELYLRALLDEGSRGFDLCELRGSDVKGRQLWDELTSLPFMAERRVVVIDSPKEIRQSEREALTTYLKKPVPTTSLVMTQVFEDRRDRLGVWASKGAAVVEFPELKPQARSKWISQYVKKSGKTISSEALSHLIETSSAQLMDIRSKLDNAILFMGDDIEEVTVQTLMKIGGVSSDYDIFRLQDAILRGNVSEALKISRSLLEGGIHLVQMLAMMRGFLMKVWQVEAALHKRDSHQIIEDVLGGQKFKSKDFTIAARRLGRPGVQQLVLELLELEVHAKSKSSDSELLFYDWIWGFSTSKSSGTRTLPLEYTG